MSVHPSALELDELAAGGAGAAARAHVAACAECEARVAELSQANASVQESVGFVAGRVKLSEERRSARLRWGLPVAAALGMAALMLLPRVPRFHTKGGPSLALVSSSGAAIATPHAGDHLELRVSTGGARFALIGARENGAAPVQLWPLAGHQSGEPGGPLAIELEVTPGAVQLVALFSARPLDDSALTSPPPDAELRALDLVPAK